MEVKHNSLLRGHPTTMMAAMIEDDDPPSDYEIEAEALEILLKMDCDELTRTHRHNYCMADSFGDAQIFKVVFETSMERIAALLNRIHILKRSILPD